MISKYVESSSKIKNSAKTAESVVIIAESVSCFAFYVLNLHNESDCDFTLSNSPLFF